MFQSHETAQFPSSSPVVADFHGFLMRRSASFSGVETETPPEEVMSDEGSQFPGEKKRRLDVEQVRALEKSFELGNKLEPERKMELARVLNLQPRQIAIWFQNRRARSKTKQLEKDYDVLKRQFDALKADNDSLKSQNKKLQSQILALKKRESTSPINLNKENECCWSTATDNSNAAAAFFPPPPTHIGGSFTDLLHHRHQHQTSEELFNVYGGMEENPDFWPWPEQQQSSSFH